MCHVFSPILPSPCTLREEARVTDMAHARTHTHALGGDSVPVKQPLGTGALEEGVNEEMCLHNSAHMLARHSSTKQLSITASGDVAGRRERITWTCSHRTLHFWPTHPDPNHYFSTVPRNKVHFCWTPTRKAELLFFWNTPLSRESGIGFWLVDESLGRMLFIRTALYK